jgi:hypothetical protein
LPSAHGPACSSSNAYTARAQPLARPRRKRRARSCKCRLALVASSCSPRWLHDRGGGEICRCAADCHAATFEAASGPLRSKRSAWVLADMAPPLHFPRGAMVHDYVLFGASVLAFATLVSVHVSLVIGLLRRRPHWHGVAALLVFPLAPWWAWQARMRVRGGIWLVAAASYATGLTLSLTG